MSGLLSKAKISQLAMGIHDNCVISNVDIIDRKGNNGPINKMIYIKFTQLDEANKRKAESELAWWKPDVTTDYFKTNLQEMCIQLHGILTCFMPEEDAFDAFENVFEASGVTDPAEIETKKWKKSEVDVLFIALKDAFHKAITPFIAKQDAPIRLKLTTNYKGEDIEIPKYGKFVESMTVDPTLKFSDAELKTHSKAGNVAAASPASSSKATI
jgi:hypothetical protein